MWYQEECSELSKKPVEDHEERSGPKTEEVVQPRIEQEPTIQAGGYRQESAHQLKKGEGFTATSCWYNRRSRRDKIYKKRPSKRSGGYDDFSAFPPTPWTPQDCPNLTVKPRRRGG